MHFRHRLNSRGPRMQTAFANIYEKLKIPVIVCSADEPLPVAYLNTAARLVLAPDAPAYHSDGGRDCAELEQIVRFRNRDDYHMFRFALGDAGSVSDFNADILSFQGATLPFRLYANAASFSGGDYFVIYLGDPAQEEPGDGNSRFLTRLLGASHYGRDVDQSIAAVLRLAGEHVGASRALVFEGDPAVRNTYEWCAHDVRPLKEAHAGPGKAPAARDALMAGEDVLIANDVRRLPKWKREILEERGVRSAAILSLRHFDGRLGWIGFEDCVKAREWNIGEISALRSTAAVAESLINRRNLEYRSRQGGDIFRAVADNLDELVYISDIDTHELKFVSKSLARAMGEDAEALLGRPCWSVLHRNQAGPCPFCPLPRMREAGSGGEAYIWELHNSVSGKWYMVKDSVIDWVDGDRVHLGTLVDITYRKQYEEQLKRFASMDAMTDVYNRKWGRGKMEELFRGASASRGERTLCFLDIDGLKTVNDRLGHAAGDELIVNAIRTVFACIRKDDFITRWGGDEFVVFLNCSPANARGVLAKINFGIEHFNATSNKSYRLSVSAGLVGFDEPFGSLDELIAEADRRMYAAKQKKRESERASLL